MSAAYAGGKAVRVIRASDSAEQDINTLSSGLLDVASLTSFLSATTGKVVTLYDQTSGANHATQGTDAARPAITLSGIGSYPCVTFAANQTLRTGNMTQAQPFCMSMVAKRTGNFTTQTQMMGADVLAHGNFLFRNAANTWAIYAGTALIASSVSDSAWHAGQGFWNGASSQVSIDGSASSGNAGASGMVAETFAIGEATGWTDVVGTFVEGGLWAGDTSASFAAMNTNQHAFYGF